ncbi:MAG: phosphatase PAP2 family protein [Chitinophagaceae bacterium]|nr:MAG: phosphatase PAP2 family protein [Chitinophagaceae bacterium]
MKKAIITFLTVVLLFSSCKQKQNKLPLDVNTLQHQCVHRLTDIIVYDIFTPPVASRMYAYCNLAYYESLRWKDKESSSITAYLKEFDPMPQPEKDKQYDYNLAAVKSFFKVAKALTFSKDSLIKTETLLLKEFENATDDEVYKNSIAFGDTIAAVILKRAAADNYKKTRGMPKYSVFKETGKWQQTPPDYADAVEPNWKLIKSMLLDSASQSKPVSPPPYDLNKNSQYYKELMEVYTTSKQLTPLQDTIAHYWDDNPFVTEHEGHLMFATKKTTPGGHWMGIISILCRQTNADDIKTAKVYALTSCAIFDGFISCWEEKYRSRMVRPITVIRENIESEWNSLLQTPPFPEYTSGHSVITAAASTVLTHLVGENIAFIDTTEMEYLGLQRSFNSIQQAADEAGISRLYGGIHYRSAIEEGKKQGQQVGKLYNSVFK